MVLPCFAHQDHRLTGSAIAQFTTPAAAEAMLREGANVPMAGRMPTVRPIDVEELAFVQKVSSWQEVSTASVLNVANLDEGVATEGLAAYFEQFGGQVHHAVHYRKVGNLAAGCGNGRVVFTNVADALRILDLFQGGSSSSGGGGSGGGLPLLGTAVPAVTSAVDVIPLHKQEETKGMQVFVGGLRDSTNAESLVKEIEQYGHVIKAIVKYVTLMTHPLRFWLTRGR